MMSGELASLVSRLEAVTTRLESLASRGGGGGGGGGGVEGRWSSVMSE